MSGFSTLLFNLLIIFLLNNSTIRTTWTVYFTAKGTHTRIPSSFPAVSFFVFYSWFIQALIINAKSCRFYHIPSDSCVQLSCLKTVPASLSSCTLWNSAISWVSKNKRWRDKIPKVCVAEAAGIWGRVLQGCGCGLWSVLRTEPWLCLWSDFTGDLQISWSKKPHQHFKILQKITCSNYSFLKLMLWALKLYI